MTTATRMESNVESNQARLMMALELGGSSWRLGFTIGPGQRPRQVGIVARDLVRLRAEIGKAKQRFGLLPEAPVVSCYEAGRDGFWVHRALTAMGVSNLVIEAASTQVDRRRRRAKTDQLDLDMLLAHLIRYLSGERRVWRIVRVPSEEVEDGRHLHRELMVLKRDRARITNRIRALLAIQGVKLKLGKGLVATLRAVRRWDDTLLPAGLRDRLELEAQRREYLEQQIAVLTTRRAQLLKDSSQVGVEQARRLGRLRALGPESSWTFAMEAFGSRGFRNRREVAAYVGLAPTPFDSGDRRREQGISKAGNQRMRWMAVELSWMWLRLQPDSALSRWYVKRFGGGSTRQRKIGIVALARKLMVALWRYLDQGIVPQGATLKP